MDECKSLWPSKVSGYSCKRPNMLHKGSVARQEKYAKHSLKCDEYSMKQNPNFKKIIHLRSVHELCSPTGISAWSRLHPPKHSSSKAYSSSSSWLLWIKLSEQNRGSKWIFSLKSRKANAQNERKESGWIIEMTCFCSLGCLSKETWPGARGYGFPLLWNFCTSLRWEIVVSPSSIFTTECFWEDPGNISQSILHNTCPYNNHH